MALRSHYFPGACRILSMALVTMAIGFVLQPSLRAGDSAMQSTEEKQAPDSSQYSNSAACGACHPNQLARFQRTKMGSLVLTSKRNEVEAKGCEACHGPGATHVESSGEFDAILRFGDHSNISSERQNSQCLQCHERRLRLFWKGSTHQSRGLTCVTCHQLMKDPDDSIRFAEPLTENSRFVKSTRTEVCYQCHKLRRSQSQLSSHMPIREGKLTCSNCHNPHGSPNPKLLLASSVNETCYNCHAERRGPFLWEHPPVMEDCSNCHEPHGSTNPQLLKVRTPRLCQRCHIETRHPTTPQLATTRFAFNRGCTNCHAQIHGTNHPSGPRFHR